MPVVIDQFEIIRDQQKPDTGATSGPQEAPRASSKSPPPLGPQDIDATLKHLTRRALRLRPS